MKVLVMGAALLAAATFTLSDDNSRIDLTDGSVFEANDHVNIQFVDTTSGNTGSMNIHLEEKCIDRDDAECAGEKHAFAQYIGWPYIDINLKPELCVSWIQVAGHNYHYENPNCLPDPEPTPPDPGDIAETGPIGTAVAASAGVGLILGGYLLTRKAKASV